MKRHTTLFILLFAVSAFSYAQAADELAIPFCSASTPVPVKVI